MTAVQLRREANLNRIPWSPLDGPRECGFFARMNIRINGEAKEIAAGLSVAALLDELQIRPGRVVVELNRKIVSREAHGSTALKEGDSLEIVHFVGGG
jgi:sulfur carrier protein